jgi:hypothetical protein
VLEELVNCVKAAKAFEVILNILKAAQAEEGEDFERPQHDGFGWRLEGGGQMRRRGGHCVFRHQSRGEGEGGDERASALQFSK